MCQSYPIGRELEIAYNPGRAAQSEIAGGYQQETNYGFVLAGLVPLAFFSCLAYRAIVDW